MFDYTIQKQKKSKVWPYALKIPGYQNFPSEEAYSHLKAIKHWENKDGKADRVRKPK